MGSRLPNLQQTFRNWNPPVSVVPPEPKRSTMGNREGVRALRERMEEFSWAGSNPFDGGSVGSGKSRGVMEMDIDFVKGEGREEKRGGVEDGSVLSDM